MGLPPRGDPRQYLSSPPLLPLEPNHLPRGTQGLQLEEAGTVGIIMVMGKPGCPNSNYYVGALRTYPSALEHSGMLFLTLPRCMPFTTRNEFSVSLDTPSFFGSLIRVHNLTV